MIYLQTLFFTNKAALDLKIINKFPTPLQGLGVHMNKPFRVCLLPVLPVLRFAKDKKEKVGCKRGLKSWPNLHLFATHHQLSLYPVA
jgi:hypothetical protein